MKKSLRLFLCWAFAFCLLCTVRGFVFAQAVDVAAFRAMSPPERLRFAQDLNFNGMDSVVVVPMLAQLCAVAEGEGDLRGVFALKFQYIKQRGRLDNPPEKALRLVEDLEAFAASHKLEVERLVAHHYATFEAYNLKKIPPERLYAEVLSTHERMGTIGFEQFKPYNVVAILWHQGQFMYRLGDLERMRKYLHAAEPFLGFTEREHLHTILVINHLQAYHQKRKEYAKAIEYAQKILHFSRELHPGDPAVQRRLRFWEGLSLLDMASMRIEQGNLSEGERYADEGYRLSVVDQSNQALDGVRGEYDALQVLLAVKLKTGKLGEAAALIHRAEALQKILNTDPKLENHYFDPLKFYNNCAQYHALRGDAAAALRFTNLARTLQDSLDRRNDARKYEQIQQRLEAEKYTAKLQMIEQEKQMQTLLRNAALLILLLTLALAWVNYRRLQAKRQQALAELDAAQHELENFAHAFREKSELAENLRLEMENLASRGERSQYLEQLTNSTILTDEDWARFRSVFEKVHPGFIEAEKSQHPDLTQAELRYLVLEKLGLGTHEMANILGVSDGTIRQTRMRLRRKIAPK